MGYGYERWGAIAGILGALAELATDILSLFIAVGIQSPYALVDFFLRLVPDSLNLGFMGVYFALDFASATGIPETTKRRAITVRRVSLYLGALLIWASAIGRFWVVAMEDGFMSTAFYFAASLANPANILLILAISLIVYGS